jgi:hypothetical protein
MSRARLYAGGYSAIHCRWCEVYRTWLPDGRYNRQADGRKGDLVESAAAPRGLRQGFPEGSIQRAKADEVWPGIAATYEWAKKYKIKTAWGTDVLFSQALAQQQVGNSGLACPLVQSRRSARHGDRTQCRTAGIVRQTQSVSLASSASWSRGALADLLLIDGNPMENIDLLADPAKNFKVIMKHGKVYKNTLGG